jgi:hypothetical protein
MSVGALVAFTKLYVLRLREYTKDYESYVATARYFNGSTGGEVYPERLLKPLAPAAVAALARLTGDYESAFVITVIAFYLALIVASLWLFREFFHDRLSLAVPATLLFVFSYPVLGYGLDLYIETGAWLFYVLALYFTLRYARSPSRRNVLLASLVIGVGFWWKEYSVVNGLVLGMMIIWHPGLRLRAKVTHAALAALPFLAFHVAWQAHIYQQYRYTYVEWYLHGGASGFKTQFTVLNLLKTPFALLMGAWTFVPAGLMRFRECDLIERRFVVVTGACACLFFTWGHVSSRLFYVMTPPLVVLAALGMDLMLPRRHQKAIALAVVLALNVTWLLVSR